MIKKRINTDLFLSLAIKRNGTAYNVIKWYLLVLYTLSGSTITIANSKK